MTKLLFIILILLTISKINIVSGQIILISEAGRKIRYKMGPSNDITGNSNSKDQVENVLYTPSGNNAEFNPQTCLKPSMMVCLPLSGKLHLTSDFGERFHPILKRESLHTGIDLRADYEIVHAIASGIIEREGYDARAGNFIVIEHGIGIESIYCHLSKFLHEPGDIVFAGDEIAVSGTTGEATGPHLHFAIKENGKFIDPVPLLQAIVRYNKIAL